MLVEVAQRQAQRHPAVLRRRTQVGRAFLVLGHQAAAGIALVQPPGQHAGALGTLQGQPGLAQGALGEHRIEHHRQGDRRAGLVDVLLHQLLRIGQQRLQARVLRRLALAGQAHHQGLQGAPHGRGPLARILRSHRLAHLKEPLDLGCRDRQGGEQQAEGKPSGDQAHAGISAGGQARGQCAQ
ncbi:hypothetical protein D3C75_868350 [compost metagenome]